MIKGVTNRVTKGVTNALVIDVDDLGDSLREAGLPTGRYRSGVARETEDVLEELDRLKLRATFFIPGHFVAEAAGLVRKMAESGHQVASHGTRHCTVSALGPAGFLEDVSRSKRVLEDLTGRPVDTYKAPIWSITPKCLWAYDALLEAGFRVDHSAVPAVNQGLGQRRNTLQPYRYRETLLVVPVTSARIFGLTLPFPGGFYNAWVPFALQRRIYDTINARGLPFNFYFHPFEHSPEPRKRRWYKHRSLYVSLYAAHSGRYRIRLQRLAKRYAMGTLAQAYARWLDGASSTGC